MRQQPFRGLEPYGSESLMPSHVRDRLKSARIDVSRTESGAKGGGYPGDWSQDRTTAPKTTLQSPQGLFHAIYLIRILVATYIEVYP